MGCGTSRTARPAWCPTPPSIPRRTGRRPGGRPGWHGWVCGWQLHLATTVAAAWVPFAAELTPANAADNDTAALLLPEPPAEVRFVLGDQHDNAPNVRGLCARADQILVASQPGGYPHTGDGVAVRRVFHKLRSAAIENVNGQFKGSFDAHGPVPTQGLANTRRFALGAILVDQLALWHRHEHGLDLRVGLKPALKAARGLVTGPQFMVVIGLSISGGPDRQANGSGGTRMAEPLPGGGELFGVNP